MLFSILGNENPSFGEVMQKVSDDTLKALGTSAKLVQFIGKSSANGSVPKSGKAEKVDKTTDDKLAK